MHVARLERGGPAEELEDLVHGRSEGQPAHAQHTTVAGVFPHCGTVTVARHLLLSGGGLEHLDVPPAHLLPVGLDDLCELGQCLKGDKSLAGGIMQHCHRLRLQRHAHVGQEVAHVLRAVAPGETAQPGHDGLLPAHLQHRASGRFSQRASSGFCRVDSDRVVQDASLWRGRSVCEKS